jgi:hypothetical protein
VVVGLAGVAGRELTTVTVGGVGAQADITGH